MKKRSSFTLLLFGLLIMISFRSTAQFAAYCNAAPRYDQEMFSSVHITSDTAYGYNIDNTGAGLTLTMDIYEPDGDTAAVRPLIVWAHGGSFVGGTKNDVDVVSLSNHFAKRGYVCASINYRLGMSTINQTGATQAVYRAVQDMKAAIRFFRKDAAGNNTFRIDPNFIVAGGSSAGAFTALHLAYLNQPSELPSQIDTTVLGGMEGNSGNPGYSSDVNCVVNLCGALGNKTWVVPGDKPLCSMHGTADNVVPYGTAMLYIASVIPIMVVDGSHSINDYANTIQAPNVMYTWYGQGHVPYASSTAYMDTTVRFVSNFLYYYMGCSPANPLPLPNTFGTTGIASVNSPDVTIDVFPNPAFEYVTVRSRFANEKILQAELYDLSGRKLRSMTGDQPALRIDRGQLPAGSYMMRVRTEKSDYVRKVCFF